MKATHPRKAKQIDDLDAAAVTANPTVMAKLAADIQTIMADDVFADIGPRWGLWWP